MERNFAFIPGNSGTVENPSGIVIRLRADGAPENLTGSDFVFRAVLHGQEVLRKDLATGVVVDVADGRITIPITVAESRSLPGICFYEIEQRIGDAQRTRLMGRLVAVGGLNDD